MGTSPKVDDYFAWANKSIPSTLFEGNTHKVLQYSPTQRMYLHVFLDNSIIPLDNNTAEHTIRPFTAGCKNRINMDSIRNADISAIM